MATPMLIASICTIDSRLLPLLADSPVMSLSVTEFMAENCIELMAPNTSNCSHDQPYRLRGADQPQARIITPSNTEFTCSTRL